MLHIYNLMMNLVLVGHGSIGSSYKDVIVKNFNQFNEFYIIDKNTNLVNELIERGFKSFESIENLKKEGISCSHGIIANWGPDHISSANSLIDIGCKRIIIEKPISSRLDELQIFKKRCEDENIFVTVHHHWNYTNITEVIENAQSKLDLGKPVGVRCLGGAVCLSTNGTHFLDLGCKILDSSPREVTADLELDYINPRHKSLVNIGGMASYKMKNGTFIHTTFSNSNSEAFRFEIIYRHGLIELTSDVKLKCYKRTEKDIKNFGHKITRYGKLEFLSHIKYEDKFTVEEVLKNLFFGKTPRVTIKEAELTVSMIFAALQSHINSQKIEFDKVIDTGILIS